MKYWVLGSKCMTTKSGFELPSLRFPSVTCTVWSVSLVGSTQRVRARKHWEGQNYLPTLHSYSSLSGTLLAPWGTLPYTTGP